MKATFRQFWLNFKVPSGTSRGVLTQKETWLLYLTDDKHIGVGECGILRGLSADDRIDYESKLEWVADNIHKGVDVLYEELREFPSIQFGLETAYLSLKSKNPFELYPSDFISNNQGIDINGLIWMGSSEEMLLQIQQKLQTGFKCIKLKIGAIDFDSELALLHFIRNRFSASEIQLRVDANGAFSPNDALYKLKHLAKYDLHSIEQPIKAGQLDAMGYLCQETPLDIALDEELIGVFNPSDKANLIKQIRPQYIILKPSLVGGFKGSQEWIDEAESLNIGWWVTSALESNVGLNAIAQWTHTLNNSLPQGLGTGSLYTNNFESPLQVRSGKLYYSKDMQWNTEAVFQS